MPATISISHRPGPPGILSLAPPHTEPSPPALPIAHLDHLLTAARLACVYQIAFPEQPELLEAEVNLASEEALAEAVAGFLKRVDEALFPVYWDLWFEVGEVEWCLYSIPVAPQGFGVGDEDPADFQEPVRLLLRLAERHYFDQADGEPFGERYPQFGAVPAVDMDSIDQLGEVLRGMALDGPLAALPDLFDMVFQQTGNPWLDVSPEMHAESGEVIDWEAETVADLAALWRQARAILDGVWALVNWVSEAPAERLGEVMEAILNAYDHQRGKP